MTALTTPLVTVSARRLPMDARTKLGLLVVINALSLAPAPLVVTLACITATAALLIFDRRGRALAWFGIVVALSLTGTYALPGRIPEALAVAASATGFFVLKYAAVIAFAVYLMGSTSPSELIFAARRLRVPEVIVIPLAITFRFLPAIADEARAVHEAMRLRLAGRRQLGPARFVEYLLVPVIAATLRTGDDLTASALTRGLGSPGPKTSLTTGRWGTGDLVGLTMGVAVTAIAVVSGGFL